MINEERWVNSLAKKNQKEINSINSEKWIDTIANKNTYDSFKKNSYDSFKKYSLLGIVFVCGLLLVSVVKNETRNLQKEINNLQASIGVIKFNLKQAILDNEVLTSPENISRLAKDHINLELVSYELSQIKELEDEKEILSKETKLDKKNNLSKNIKLQIAQRIEAKKMEIKKLQNLYSNPKTIPKEIKIQIAKEIDEKKEELKNIYHSPKDVISQDKFYRWGVVQVVKAFLGMPIIPGR